MMQIEKKGVVYILVSCVWLAWLCSILTVTQCNFMTTTIKTTQYSNILTDFSDPNNNNNGNDDNTGLIRTVHKRFGLFSRPYFDDYDDTFLGCIRYVSKEATEKDTKFRTGQAFGLITILLLTVSSIITSGIVLLDFSHRTSDHDSQLSRPYLWRVAQYLSIAAAITQLFTFIALGSTEKCYLNSNDDDEFHSAPGGCTISASAKLAIFNTVLLDGICLLWFLVTVPDTPLLQVRLCVSTKSTHVNDGQQTMPKPAEDQQDDHRNDLVIVKHTEENHYLDDTDSIASECTNAELNIIPVDHTSGHETSRHDNNGTTESSTNTMSSHLQRYQFQYRLITVLLVAIAWMMSILGVHRCTLVVAVDATTNVDDNYDDDNTTNQHNQPQYRSGIGLYQLAIHDEEQHFLGCVAYPSHMIQDTFDSTFRTARAFGAITTLITSAILILSILQLFQNAPLYKMSMVNRTLFLLAIVSEATTFAIFRSDVCNNDGEVICRLGGTGKLVILNILLLLVISVLVYISSDPKEPLFEMVRVPTNGNGKNLKSFVSCPSPKAIKEALPNFKNIGKKELHSNEINDSNDQLSTDGSGTIEMDTNVDDNNDLYVTSVIIQVEYSDNEKTTRKIITYQDGTQTIHTTIEETYEDDDEIADFAGSDDVKYLE